MVVLEILDDCEPGHFLVCLEELVVGVVFVESEVWTGL